MSYISKLPSMHHPHVHNSWSSHCSNVKWANVNVHAWICVVTRMYTTVCRWFLTAPTTTTTTTAAVVAASLFPARSSTVSDVDYVYGQYLYLRHCVNVGWRHVTWRDTKFQRMSLCVAPALTLRKSRHSRMFATCAFTVVGLTSHQRRFHLKTIQHIFTMVKYH